MTWTIDPNSYATGIDLPNVVTIGADAFGDQIMDVSGQTLIPFSYTFFTTNVAPTIVSSSIDGQVFSPAPANATEVVTFSQPMNTSFTTASSFELHGNYRSVFYAAASWSWDPTGTILTINFSGLPDDSYTITLLAGGFDNVVGIPLASDYIANFAVALGERGFRWGIHAFRTGRLPDLYRHRHSRARNLDRYRLPDRQPERRRDADRDRNADHAQPPARDRECSTRPST